ncbi:hypothetical protein FIV42_22545 [Persicimonas caeni]|uniref:Uncharacterized protein n=1 Tax=Persicimonas caeni TaxID=2292766 RepID=A0A4Y6PYV8_PERCE|nr:hypothetical protein [Persicimonas caeni]QDG53420.1 hypothetical protein FIV42_22545 [Persicimonas caeni]QED34641.1 hypothetical protein FRD00_22540 [Persicimonas caeni]
MNSLLSKDIVAGAFCTLVLAETVNWICWFVHLLDLHLQPGTPANFLPFLIPLAWPLLPLLMPGPLLAVVVPCAVVVALLFRYTDFPGPLPRRRKLAVYAAIGFAVVYAASFPLFWVWNLGGG